MTQKDEILNKVGKHMDRFMLTIFNNNMATIDKIRYVITELVELHEKEIKICKLQIDNATKAHQRDVAGLVKVSEENTKLKAEIDKLKDEVVRLYGGIEKQNWR